MDIGLIALIIVLLVVAGLAYKFVAGVLKFIVVIVAIGFAVMLATGAVSL